MTLTLPTPILTAVEAANGHITVIVGAGCSLEPPTEIPLADQLSRQAYQRLVDNDVIPADACDEPENLSALAKAVEQATGGQSALVEILPRGDFRSAEPNRGYRNVAALLRERAIADVVTLNFDLALAKAISDVGGRKDVMVIPGPERHSDLGTTNAIFLHRNVECTDFEEWILTVDALEEAWADDRWETVVVGRCAAAPVVIFAGLGSRADVLERSIARINEAVRNEVFLVDPDPPGTSEFSTALGLDDDRHIEARWVEFTDAMADRLALEQRRAQLQACIDQAEAEGRPRPTLNQVGPLLEKASLLELGKMRADLMLNTRSYECAEELLVAMVADLLLVIDFIAESLACEADLHGPGLVSFTSEDGRRRALLGFASGRGVRSSLSIEPDIGRLRAARSMCPESIAYVVTGVKAWDNQSVTPANVVVESEPDSVVTPQSMQLFPGHEILNGTLPVEGLI